MDVALALLSHAQSLGNHCSPEGIIITVRDRVETLVVDVD
jgi:hypothetical protein